MKLTAIEAAMMENRSEGSFAIVGRKIEFRAGQFAFAWNCRTEAAARQQLRIFRAAPKYLA